MVSLVDEDVKRIQARGVVIEQRFGEIAGEEEALRFERTRLENELSDILGASKEIQKQTELALGNHR